MQQLLPHYPYLGQFYPPPFGYPSQLGDKKHTILRIIPNTYRGGFNYSDIIKLFLAHTKMAAPVIT
jgi:hypothetical protein